MRCTVEILGFPPSDQRTFAATFSLSARREISFTQWHSTATEQPDLLVVDGDNPQALETLGERQRKGECRMPVVTVAAKESSSVRNFLERPIRFLKLFKMFDEVLLQSNAPGKVTDKIDSKSTLPDAFALTPMASLPVQAIPQLNQVDASSNGFKPMPIVRLSATPHTSPSPENPLVMVPANQQISNRQHGDWVLVVDDNLAVRRFMAQKLEPFNINVDFAASGEQAIGLSGTKHYTCIFLDVVMPGIDGYQVCKIIKGNRVSKDVKVVMLTSRDSPFDKIRGKMAGCDAYLTKPVDEDKLMNTIVRFLPEGAMMGDALEKNSIFSPH